MISKSFKIFGNKFRENILGNSTKTCEKMFTNLRKFRETKLKFREDKNCFKKSYLNLKK